MLGDDGCVVGSGAVFDEGGLDGTGSGKGAAWFLEGSDSALWRCERRIGAEGLGFLFMFQVMVVNFVSAVLVLG